MDSQDIIDYPEEYVEQVIEGIQFLDKYYLKMLKVEIQNRINDLTFEEMTGERR